MYIYKCLYTCVCMHVQGQIYASLKFDGWMLSYFELYNHKMPIPVLLGWCPGFLNYSLMYVFVYMYMVMYLRTCLAM